MPYESVTPETKSEPVKRGPRGPYGKRAKKKENRKKKTKKRTKSPVNAEKASITLLCYYKDGEAKIIEIDESEAHGCSFDIFQEEDDVQEVYLMKPVKMFKKPVIEIVDL
jgi:hypothetical protein